MPRRTPGDQALQTPVSATVPPVPVATKVPMPDTVTGVPAGAVTGTGPAGVATDNAPVGSVKVSVELTPEAVPHTAVVLVMVTVSWIWAATSAASVDGHCHDPAASSWKPRKCTTRHDATASVGDHDVAPAAAATSLTSAGRALYSVSALANSWATRASDGAPEKTVVSTPEAQDVQPVA